MNRCVAVLVGAVLAAVSASGGDAVRGHLYIIGGGDRPPELMLPYIGLAGDAGKARICVLPMASATPESTGVRLAQEFLALGAREAFPLVVTRATADEPATVRKLGGVSGVFFSGGDQSRVTAAILNTATHRRLLELYRSGAVIGGTSAGAAIMSRVMITGDERLNKDTVNAFLFIRRDNVVTTEGLGFIEGAIIDQHFVYRKRHNRLISLVLEHPSLVGIGIDEATALLDAAGRASGACGRVDPAFSPDNGVRCEPVASGGAGCVPMVRVRGDLVDPKRHNEVQLLTVLFPESPCGEQWAGRPTLKSGRCDVAVPLIRELDWRAVRALMGW